MMTDEKYNFVKIFERALRDNWERPAVTDYDTDVTLTYGQLAINIEKLHILFKACGASTTLAHNGYQFVLRTLPDLLSQLPQLPQTDLSSVLRK